MNELLDRIRRYAAEHSLWSPSTRVVAAVSGGSDSVALLLALHELGRRGELVLAGVAHLHHHVRGADADGDAAFCRALAERLAVPLATADADVPGEAAREGVSIEVAGRAARQRFFVEAMQSLRAERVAVAHTRDDQAETVLLRLTRGAGASGLSGIAPRRDHLVRPLLAISRGDLQEFLRERNEPWREDSTNQDRSIPRNLIRHEVMPRLRTINAQADAALARAADILRSEEQFLERLANAAFLRSVEADEERETVTVEIAEFSKLPAALARRVARYALETANPSRSYGLDEVDDLCRAVRGTAANIPGLTMERFAATVVLTSRAPESPRPVTPIELRLDVPGTVELPHGGWTMTAEGPMPLPAHLEGPDDVAKRDTQVMVEADGLGRHLIVRYRRPGDRLHPLGAPGRKKVQDVLVDRKVPRDDRDTVPIVTTRSGEIVWVAGQVLEDRFRVTSLTRSVVVLTLRR